MFTMRIWPKQFLKKCGLAQRIPPPNFGFIFLCKGKNKRKKVFMYRHWNNHSFGQSNCFRFCIVLLFFLTHKSNTFFQKIYSSLLHYIIGNNMKDINVAKINLIIFVFISHVFYMFFNGFCILILYKFFSWIII